MRNRSAAAALAVGLSLALPAPLPARAQQPSATPATMALAKQLIQRITPDRDQTLGALSAPMIGMMRQFGVNQPDRAKALVTDAIMPTLRDHYDELLTAQADAYAEVLSEADLKAILAFYDTPAGKDLVAATPRLEQLKVVSMTHWMGQMQPELQQKVQAMMKAHGWDQPG